MPFHVIKGTFHVLNYSPDGDSIRFKADDDSNWDELDGNVTLNARGHAQLRLEAIDTLETHFQSTHQPLELARKAMDFLLEGLGITGVEWNAARTKVVAANDGTKGYIVTREAEKNGRPVSFAFAGQTTDADGSALFFNEERLRQSLNYKSLAAGLAYPTYYTGLFSDLRSELTIAAQRARQANAGIWAVDKTNEGFEVDGLQAITNEYVILPKLFRRLAEFLEGGGNVAGFKNFLASKAEGVTILPTAHFTHFDTVINVTGNTVKMTVPPENLVFAG